MFWPSFKSTVKWMVKARVGPVSSLATGWGAGASLDCVGVRSNQPVGALTASWSNSYGCGA